MPHFHDPPPCNVCYNDWYFFNMSSLQTVFLYEKRHLTCLGIKVWVLDRLELQFDVRSTGLKSPSKNPQMVAPVGVDCKTIPSVKIFGRVKPQHELNKSNKIIPREMRAIILNNYIKITKYYLTLFT